jgi:hypothetical protein
MSDAEASGNANMPHSPTRGTPAFPFPRSSCPTVTKHSLTDSFRSQALPMLPNNHSTPPPRPPSRSSAFSPLALIHPPNNVNIPVPPRLRITAGGHLELGRNATVVRGRSFTVEDTRVLAGKMIGREGVPGCWKGLVGGRGAGRGAGMGRRGSLGG